MSDPITITASLIFVGSAVVDAVKSKGKDAAINAGWDKLKPNLVHYRPYPNDELQRTAYRAYLEATLQSCAALLKRKGLKVEAWFKLGTLPEKMGEALRSLLQDAPAGVFTNAAKQWLEKVSRDHISKLKLLDQGKIDAPSTYEQDEFGALLAEIELLLQPKEAQDRERAIREALAKRVLDDLELTFGSSPEEFSALVRQRWFEFLCAAFQFHINHKPEVASAFETRLRSSPATTVIATARTKRCSAARIAGTRASTNPMLTTAATRSKSAKLQPLRLRAGRPSELCRSSWPRSRCSLGI